MNARQINKVTMSKAVQLILTSFGNDLQTPAYARTISVFNNTLSSIEGLMQTQSKKTTGAAIEKDEAQDAAIEAAMSIIGPTRSYALAVSDNSLDEILSYSASGLKGTRDEVLLSILKMIRDVVQSQLPNLEDYGVMAENVNALTSAIAYYSPLVSAPRAAISVKSAVTEALEIAVAELEMILKRLDGLAEGKRNTRPDFFNSYTSARVVVDAGGSYRKQDVSPNSDNGM
jgi:hypothetical protein